MLKTALPPLRNKWTNLKPSYELTTLNITCFGRHELKSIPFSIGSVDEIYRHLEAVPAQTSIADVLNVWMDESVLAAIKQFVNSNLEQSAFVSTEEIRAFIEVELWLGFYSTTPGSFYNHANRTLYPSSHNVMSQARFMQILSALGKQRQRSSGSTAMWTAPMAHDRDLAYATELLRRLCSEFGSVEGVSISSLDDDMIRLRSTLVDESGLAHVRNPKKGHVASRGESNVDIVKILQRSLCSATTESQIRLPGIVHALDRGYQSEAVHQQIHSVGGKIVGTHKRTCRFPFTYGTRASQYQREIEVKVTDPDAQFTLMVLSFAVRQDVETSLNHPAIPSQSDLEGMTNENLRSLCRDKEFAISGNKSTLIERLCRPSRHQTMETSTSISGELLSSWFMTPSFSSATKIGTHNEPRIAAHFLKEHSAFVVEKVKSYGLLCARGIPYAAFSPDDIAAVSSDDRGKYHAVFEYKTRVNDQTEQQETILAERFGVFTKVELMTNELCGNFKDLLPDGGHRSQILHNIVCGGVQDGFLIFASKTQIIRVVHVQIGDDVATSTASDS
ncbi:LOW QUALITY PROTEIN: hypothetical protein PHMEG_00021605 [Phytophthora megakarya]|uniref:PiggyBac transposable element-derived protein domain-containing protein n=1 Tax=Phytophthora megakarya TaxID=4795 RepID=A0A225VN42_9STRA|nr:LOW QUALITY PROTEIN: hypothetical protein PHMEG_00021605 [Phytophthora megakarya]